MKITRASAFVAYLLASSIALAGCSGSHPQEVTPRFDRLPKDCSGLNSVTLTAVRTFAGKIFDAGSKFATGNNSELPPSMKSTFMNCVVSFGGPIPSPNQAVGDPSSRQVAVQFMDYVTSSDPVGSAVNSFAQTRDEFHGTKAPLADIGDEAFTGVDSTSGDTASVRTVFRVANLIVTVITKGENHAESATSDLQDPTPELVNEVKAGAESVARAAANGIDKVMQ
ncbi:hypothetical protein NRB20_36140 [Nocardia sp. RB20]|uniref:Lipoprotein n=2 Tax=Nocardia macrotermitis TaxID=2585198 RepID=A0A7K0D461_9NOCA|nr:hypothetical protein [Nocardia macrotermitis]